VRGGKRGERIIGRKLLPYLISKALVQDPPRVSEISGKSEDPSHMPLGIRGPLTEEGRTVSRVD